MGNIHSKDNNILSGVLEGQDEHRCVRCIPVILTRITEICFEVAAQLILSS